MPVANLSGSVLVNHREEVIGISRKTVSLPVTLDRGTRPGRADHVKLGARVSIVSRGDHAFVATIVLDRKRLPLAFLQRFCA